MEIRKFIQAWSKVTLKERSVAQSHFLDLCEQLDHAKPAHIDPEGVEFCFEKGVTQQGGKHGWADVWKRKHFGWEYKSKNRFRSFDDAFNQLNRYRDRLENPPLLVVSDIERYEIRTNFNDTVTKTYEFTNQDLEKPEIQDLLRSVFFSPEKLRPGTTPVRVTEEAAAEFCEISDKLNQRGIPASKSAHFLMKLIFCLFAQDVGLLKRGIFSTLVEKTKHEPPEFARKAKELFAAMARGGRRFDYERIRYFDGGLFADNEVLPLEADELTILAKLSRLDWGSVEPVIFGTLFERSLNPARREALGVHYTSRSDIETIVEPVLMQPLRREWEGVRGAISEAASAGKKKKAERLLVKFQARLQTVNILDPACGSGNFLYVSLRLLKDLEMEAIKFVSRETGVLRLPIVDPQQLYGIEINPYAHELASVVVWIGHLQWLRDNGFSPTEEPILKPLKNIARADAIVGLKDGSPKEPDWIELVVPEDQSSRRKRLVFDAIVGNPPFLGVRLMRLKLGDKYVRRLFDVYKSRLPNASDMVCYWFEKTRALIEQGRARRAGLLATQGIRGGENAKVLHRIKETGDIFFAVSDREWVQDDTMVHVSMVGFDSGNQKNRVLDGRSVAKIHANLSSGVDTGQAVTIPWNKGVAHQGDTKGRSFDITEPIAKNLLALHNPHGKPNAEVVRPWVNTDNLINDPHPWWIIDFDDRMSEEEAALYEGPYELAVKTIKPEWDKPGSRSTKAHWWIHERPRPKMRAAMSRLDRFIVTPTVSKHRVFLWLTPTCLPDHQLIAIMRSDDYCFGVLHSRIHEVWARRKGTQLREAKSGGRYTHTTTFETFPFPWPLGSEPSDPKKQGHRSLRDISDAAKALVELRDPQLWLPHRPKLPGMRSLTQLYNDKPKWLKNAHFKLDLAVMDAYGWPHGLDDQEILKRLLELNRAQSVSK